MPPPEVGVITPQAAQVPLTAASWSAGCRRSAAPTCARACRACCSGACTRKAATCKEGQVLFLIDPAPLQAALGPERGVAGAGAGELRQRQVGRRSRARSWCRRSYISQVRLDNAARRRTQRRPRRAAGEGGRARRRASTCGYATVRAPISGRAGKQQVTEGALVGQGDATLLTTVDQIDPLYVDFSMSVESWRRCASATRQRHGARVQVLLPDGSVYAHPGTLDFSGDIVDPATGAVALRARVPNPEHQLLPGTFVTRARDARRAARGVSRSAGRGAARRAGRVRAGRRQRRQGRAQERDDATDRTAPTGS